jgi:soluble lytic murein transglycosylase
VARKKRLRLRNLIILIILIVAVLNTNNFLRMAYPFPYEETIRQEAAANGLEPSLLAAVIRTESNFRAGAVSPKGAVGLMQIMPETGRWIALQSGMNDFNENMLYDPEVNIRLGAWYLANLYEEFDNQTVTTLAAYNGGRGNVKKWLAETRWTGDLRNLDSIPYAETRNFVRKVLWHEKLFRYLYG